MDLLITGIDEADDWKFLTNLLTKQGFAWTPAPAPATATDFTKAVENLHKIKNRHIKDRATYALCTELLGFLATAGTRP